MTGFSDFCFEYKPDLVIVHGDRFVALACVLVCATNYIRSAHIEGGEVSGTIDEVFRHCNSKLASHHFVSSLSAARRVMSLGEPEELIHVIGSPELDFHSKPTGVSLKEVKARYEIPFTEYGIVVFHPVTSEIDDIGDQASSLFSALLTSRKSFIVITPNNDPGSEQILDVINTLPEKYFRSLPSMRFAHFSELMRNSYAIIGNSSTGVREAPFLGIPSLDIGTRQKNRSIADSIFKASAFDHDVIFDFLNNQWGRRYTSHNAFGEGGTSTRFVNKLKDKSFWSASLQKTFNDITN